MVKRLFPYFKKLWVRLFVAIFCMAGVAAISTAVMWLMKFLIDESLAIKDTGALNIGIVVILSMFALKSILWYSHTYLTAFVSQSISRKLRDQVYGHLYSLSLGFFDEKTSGNILSRLTNDVTMLQISLASAPTILIRDGLTIMGLIGFLLYLHWKFALVCFLILPLAALILTKLGIKSRRAGRESQERMADMYSVIQEALTAMPIVKTFQNEAKEINDFAVENRNYFNVIMKLVRVEAQSSPIMEVLGSLVLALIIGVGGHDVIQGNWSLGEFMAFIGAAMSLYNPIKKFAKVNVQMQMGLAAAERIFHLLDQKPMVVDNPNAVNAPTFSKDIAFKNVDFQYPTSLTVLNKVNLNIHKGEIVALVGPSGSGKTTIAQLLLRFYDPLLGSIELDGVDIRNLTIKSLRSKMAIVTQETHLFNETVSENIAYGKPGSKREEIIQAAKLAYAHDFIQNLPNGYETIIGERGTRLSGGERQRIAIARSILKDPEILILDEATSALDAESEQMVQKAFDSLLQKRTVLVIAHRLATVRKSNRIIVLENGKIKESGNHEDLLEKKGMYHKLFELQSLV
ncbi:hypothetical protein BVX98_05405 [bacterium F11]|nr:hypothetical protein BVX98_05405 [bacterium F11]